MASLKRWLDRRRNPWKGIFFDAFAAWKRDNGPDRLYSYGDLPDAPVVFDFGGFKGEWSDIVLQQSPTAVIHVFEPHPGFAETLDVKFRQNANVHVHSFALGSRTTTMQLSDEGDASSAIASHTKTFSAKFQAVPEFFDEHEIDRIDLIKINIEGGEYDLLPALISSGVIQRIQRLQVQFHLFEPSLEASRNAIRADLAKTHECIWEYPFVWEEWRLKT